MSSKFIFSFYLPSPLFCSSDGQKNKYYFDSGFLLIYIGWVLYTTIILELASFKEQLTEKITHMFKVIELNLFFFSCFFLLLWANTYYKCQRKNMSWEILVLSVWMLWLFFWGRLLQCFIFWLKYEFYLTWNSLEAFCVSFWRSTSCR